MTAAEHYERAEELLADGVRVVGRIAELADERRKTISADDQGGRIRQTEITAQMDELGRQAMDIWAQAQVHATLANAPLRGANR